MSSLKNIKLFSEQVICAQYDIKVIELVEMWNKSDLSDDEDMSLVETGIKFCEVLSDVYVFSHAGLFNMWKKFFDISEDSSNINTLSYIYIFSKSLCYEYEIDFDYLMKLWEDNNDQENHTFESCGKLFSKIFCEVYNFKEKDIYNQWTKIFSSKMSEEEKPKKKSSKMPESEDDSEEEEKPKKKSPSKKSSKMPEPEDESEEEEKPKKKSPSPPKKSSKMPESEDESEEEKPKKKSPPKKSSKMPESEDESEEEEKPKKKSPSKKSSKMPEPEEEKPKKSKMPSAKSKKSE
jgi:hypothetical protein